jgi:N-acetylglucosaminyldiphosphoundecaprenol N-acetyl-beta-D-mannosaminyltransferase
MLEIDDCSADATAHSFEANNLFRPERRNRELSGLRKRLAILGVPIDNLTVDQALGILERCVDEGGFHQVATANVDFLIKAIRDDDLMAILHSCSMVLPDGMPIVWASRLLRHPLKERVAGADLVPRLAELAARKSYGIYLLGAEEDRSAAATAWINKTYPQARVVGRCSPPFTTLERMNNEAILSDLERTKPDILLVAFGNPKQEKWIAMHQDRLKVPVCVGVGASLDFLSGVQHRAPSRMQASGLEWLHRLYREPRRLAPRYSSNAVGLLRYFSLQLLTAYMQPSARRTHTLSNRWIDGYALVTVSGTFSESAVIDFVALLNKIDEPRAPVILELSGTRHVGADALGALISLRHRMRRQGRPLWLVGVKPSVRRVLRAAILDSRFHFAHDVGHAIRRIDNGNLSG